MREFLLSKGIVAVKQRVARPRTHKRRLPSNPPVGKKSELKRKKKIVDAHLTVIVCSTKLCLTLKGKHGNRKMLIIHQVH